MASALPAVVASASPAGSSRGAEPRTDGIVDRQSGKAPDSFGKALEDAGARPRQDQAPPAASKARADTGAGAVQAETDRPGARHDPTSTELPVDPVDALPLEVLISGWPQAAVGLALGGPLAASLAAPAGGSMQAAGFAGTAGWLQCAANPAAIALSASLPGAGIAVGTDVAQAPVAALPQVAPATLPAAAHATTVLNVPLVALAAGIPDASLLLPDFESVLRRHGSGDGEAPAPFALAPASNPAGAPLGLARASVVNPMAAPSADLHGDDFAETVGSRLTWMAEQKIGHAHIRINPAELGPVEIRMRLDGDRVHADFSSGQAEVRQALESSLPRLRDMLAAQGFSLGHAGVGDHGQPPSSDARGGGSGTSEHPAGATEPGVQPGPARRALRGLLDAYA